MSKAAPPDRPRMVRRTRTFDPPLIPEPRLHSQRGFTYVTLLIYLAIVSGAFAAIVSAGASAQRREKEIELLHIGEQFRKAFKSYYDATPPGQKPYPDSLQALLRDPRFPVPKRHLRQIFPDPITATTRWGQKLAPGGGVMGIYSLSDELLINASSVASSDAATGTPRRYSEWIFGYIPFAPAKNALRDRKS